MCVRIPRTLRHYREFKIVLNNSYFLFVQTNLLIPSTKLMDGWEIAYVFKKTSISH